VILAPSILACDLGHLADQIAAVERGGAGLVHVDVMDGRFVPNISLGPVVVEACRRATRLPVDVHLMIESAERYLDAFADAGASSISVHVEALPHLQRAIDQLRRRGVKGGVALRRLRETIRARALPARIQVDGGVHGGNIRAVVEAGAEIVVAGAAAFAGGDPETAVRSLLEAAR
jgi:ribulose-phosphate 3-epimerase